MLAMLFGILSLLKAAGIAALNVLAAVAIVLCKVLIGVFIMILVLAGVGVLVCGIDDFTWQEGEKKRAHRESLLVCAIFSTFALAAITLFSLWIVADASGLYFLSPWTPVAIYMAAAIAIFAFLIKTGLYQYFCIGQDAQVAKPEQATKVVDAEEKDATLPEITIIEDKKETAPEKPAQYGTILIEDKKETAPEKPAQSPQPAQA